MTRIYYSNDLKLRIAREALELGNAATVARRHEIHNSVIYRWMKQYRERGEAAFQDQPGAAVSGNQHALERENAQLKTLLGEKELEIAILRDLVKKRPVARRPAQDSQVMDRGTLCAPYFVLWMWHPRRTITAGPMAVMRGISVRAGHQGAIHWM